MTRSKTLWLSLFALLAIAACSNGDEISFFSLGTDVSITIYGVGGDTAQAVDTLLPSRYERLGRDWYPWADGELAAVNSGIAEGKSNIELSPSLARIVDRARDIEVLSHGRFNAGIGRLTELWELHDLPETLERPPSRDEIRRAKRGASLISVDLDGSNLVRANRNTMIDLGGIAKGAIIRDTFGLLEEQGVSDAIVNIGGDLGVMGKREARIGIQSPHDADVIAGLNIVGGEAVMTSGSYERYVEIDDQRYPHVIDPRTGHPVQHTVSVTVIDKDAMLADASATALMVAGVDEFEQTVRGLGLTYALLIGASGELCLTQAMAERLDWLADEGREHIAAVAEGSASSACFSGRNGG
ncbi:MAG: FAD:protein FMN transferase [Pseudomonadota bacterium]